MNIKTKTKRFDAKPKRFSWNLELNNNLLQILKTHFYFLPEKFL